MKRTYLKKAFALTTVIALSASMFAGCGDNKPEEPANTTSNTDTSSTSTDTGSTTAELSGDLLFWHFNKDEGPQLAKQFEGKNPKVKVQVQITPTDNLAYRNKVTAAARAGSGLPDILALEAGFVKYMVNLPNCTEDLTALGAEEVAKNLVPYTVDIGKDKDGIIRGLSWQAAPGTIGYKRSIAKEYFGTDDPEQVAALLAPDKIVDTAKTLAQKSGGKAVLVPGLDELTRVYMGGRTQPWIVDNKLVIDQVMLDYIDVAKQLRDLKQEGGLRAWKPAWASAVADNKHMCWAIPPWGIPWIIEVNDKDRKDKGEWALAKPSYNYYWGGTWLGVGYGSKNKELAWEFIKFTVADQENLASWAKTANGDCIGTIENIKANAADDSLVVKTLNQNPYKVFEPFIAGIDGKMITEYDDTITNDFNDKLETYLAGKYKDKDTMLKEFKKKVKTDIPTLEVDM